MYKVELDKAFVHSILNGKGIISFQDVWFISRPKDLLLLPSPLRLIDPINPVFNLHDYAAVFLYDTRFAGVVEETLRLLESEGAY